ncbi:hypothetical protein SAMN04487866_12244 [Thermoactinomyces sp. DSM 45891]|uniref:VirB4 family type IV secretion system protein n=1 Tax=Thermoactinomyces sp. DSM 45891 TaxID=1761907 RepID=UPI000913ADD9|nr:hypothetical protein [Thermoactinomyces sp. DSM 45891]SFX75311.1 hypothetical protein SAMN04487866_12244 [Thermoactinomyces sp. DSM 45891]
MAFWKSKKKEKVSLENMIGDNSGFLNMVSPDSVEEQQNYIRLGGNYCRTLAVAHFSSDVEANFLERLHNVNANVSVIHHIEPASSSAMERHLNRSIIENQSKSSEPYVRPVDRIRAEKNVENAEILLTNLTMGKTELFNEHMLIHIQASSLDELNLITHSLKTQNSQHLKLVEPNFQMMEAFYSVLPIQSHRLGEITYRNFDAEALSSLFPFDECEIYSERGVIKGKNLKTNSIVMVDHDELLNRNEVVIGMAGGGKSTYLWGDIVRRWILGTIVRVICPKGEFGEKVQQLGGEWIKLSPTGESKINLFEIIYTTIPKDENGKAHESSLLHQKISRLKTLFSLIYRDLKSSQVEESLLEQVLVKLYKNKGITWDTDFSKLKSTDYPILQDLYDQLGKLIGGNEERYKRLDNLYQVLYPYVEGSYSNVFNGHTNVDLSNDLIVFDIFDLRDEGDLQQVAMFNILTFLQDDALKDKSIKQIFIDEAHILADPQNPMAMKFLSTMYKLIRGFRGGCTSATQQVGDFLSAVEGSKNYGEAVISQSISKLYLPMLQDEINTIKSRTSENFSEEEERLLVVRDADRTKNAGKGIYVSGSKKVSIQIELSPEELRIWDPERYEKSYRHKIALVESDQR